MISIKNINKTFSTGLFQKKVRAVTDLNLTIQAGEIFGIVGPNGAGKSTLLKMLMGFIRPDSGQISIFGNSPLDPKTRTNMGYLPESPYYYDHLSAEDLMKFSAETAGMTPKETRPAIDRLLKTMNLEHARTRPLRSYSKGMTQRAGICFSLVHDPDLVIFDEPMSGLDPLGRKLVVDLILSLKQQGKTLLFCSHILNDVERLCDRMAIMNKGEVRAILTKEEILSSQSMASLAVSDLPEAVRPAIEQAGGTIAKEEDAWQVSCKRNHLEKMFQVLAGGGVSIEALDTSDTPLEQIFLRTIEKGSDTCIG